MKSSCIIAWRIYDYANVLVLTPVLVDQNLKYGILLCIITNVPGLMCCHSFILDQVFALMRLISVLHCQKCMGWSFIVLFSCVSCPGIFVLSQLLNRWSHTHQDQSVSFLWLVVIFIDIWIRYAYVKAQQAVSVCVMCLLRFVTVLDALINIAVLFK